MLVLLVEDNPGDIFLTEELFEDLNLNVSLKILTNGEEAIEYLSNYRNWTPEEVPSLIILDINLPRKNGHQVKEFINTKKELSKIPVFMVTTSSALMDKNKCQNNKVNAFFTKPIDPISFKSALIDHQISVNSLSI
ncbi:response regulator [Christiangramia aquimixticola]|uniref:response regulator n=1 Tax=Christiangramia aquimixticola TaxID=1697558 RepID=UPI003AA94148